MKKYLILLAVLFVSISVFGQQNYDELSNQAQTYVQQHDTEYQRLLDLFNTRNSDNMYARYQLRINGINNDIVALETEIETLITEKVTNQMIQNKFKELDSKRSRLRSVINEFNEWKNNLSE